MLIDNSIHPLLRGAQSAAYFSEKSIQYSSLNKMQCSLLILADQRRFQSIVNLEGQGMQVLSTGAGI